MLAEPLVAVLRTVGNLGYKNLRQGSIIMSLKFKLDGEDEFIKGLELLQSNEPYHIRKAFSYFCAAAEKGHIEAIF